MRTGPDSEDLKHHRRTKITGAALVVAFCLLASLLAKDEWPLPLQGSAWLVAVAIPALTATMLDLLQRRKFRTMRLCIAAFGFLSLIMAILLVMYHLSVITGVLQTTTAALAIVFYYLERL